MKTTRKLPVKKPNLIVRAVAAEIANPANCSWEELGGILRSQRAQMHRLMNAAALDCALAWRSGKEGAQRTIAYQSVGDELQRIREWGAANERPDLAVFDLPGGTQSAVADMGYQAFQRWIKSGFKDRLPTQKIGAPIPLRAQETELVEREGLLILRMKLLAGRGDWHEMRLKAGKGSSWDRLRRIARGDVKQGGIKILRDRQDPKKWMVRIAFSEERPALRADLDPSKVMVVHRGMHNAIYVVSSNGWSCALERGNSYLAIRRRIQARKTSMQSSVGRDAGTGPRGHGRDRRFEAYESLDDKLARISATTCQQWAAHLVRYAIERGHGTVAIGAWGGIEPSTDRDQRRFLERFPFFRLKAEIQRCAENRGVRVIEIPEFRVSFTCPACGNQDATQHVHRTGIFHCRNAACSFDRPADLVAGLWMLKLGGIPCPAWDKIITDAVAVQKVASELKTGARPEKPEDE
jgi:transposase